MSVAFSTLDDVRAVMGDILWDLTPQEVAVKTRQSLGSPDAYRKVFDTMRGYYFCISVWGCKANLALVDHRVDIGNTHVIEIDIPDADLETAVFEQGGSMLISGLYGINEKIKGVIRDKLKGETS